MSPLRPALVLLCCGLVGLTGVVAVAGAPPPSQLCGVCGPGIADDSELTGATGPGTLDVYVDGDGDSLWHARIPVTDAAADRYRADATALEAAVDDAWARYHAADGDVRTVDATLEGSAVVVNYTVDDVAERGVGDAWIVDYFAVGPGTTRYRMAADRVTIHAPAETVVTNRPAHATVDGNAATWTRGEGAAGDFDEQTYVTYGESGVLGTASGYATVGLAVGPPALVRGLVVGVVPGALIGLVGAATGRTRWGCDAVDCATLERLIVAAGAVGAVGFLGVGAAATGGRLPPGAASLAALGFGYALLGVAAARLGPELGTRGLLGLAVAATAVAGVVGRLLAGPAVYGPALPFGLATALFLPIGHAFERGKRPFVPLSAAALAPIVAAAIAVPTLRLSSWHVVLAVLLLLPWAGVVAAFGYPLALVGRRLAVDRRR
jgi:hypothetical protein